MVKTLANILWLVLAGFWLFLGYVVAGIRVSTRGAQVIHNPGRPITRGGPAARITHFMVTLSTPPTSLAVIDGTNSRRRYVRPIAATVTATDAQSGSQRSCPAHARGCSQ
jgi:hypothetical protein